MNKTDKNFRHPLMDWLLGQFHQVGDARLDPPRFVTALAYTIDTATIIAKMGCPQAGRDAAKANRAYKLVAEDVLGCAEKSGELVRDKDGWYTLPPEGRP